MEFYIIMVIIGVLVLMISSYSLGKSNGEAPHLFKENSEIEELVKENEELKEKVDYQKRKIEYLLNFRETQNKVDEDF